MAPARIITISSGPDRDAPIPASDARHENQWYNQDFDGYRITEQPLHAKRHIRMICVGAGAAGLQIAYKAERLLENVELQIYEKNHDIGGTWLENRYPGCTCDIPSHSYQFTWEKNPNWSHFYSSSEEIWRYFKHVSTKYDLEKYVKFNTKVQSARWDEDAGMWRLIVIAADGSQFEDECEVLVNGSGVLKYGPFLVEACSARSLTLHKIAPTNIRTSQASKSLVESSCTVRPGMTTMT